MDNIFYKKINKNNNKEMFEYLKNHYTYFTMSYWNRLRSVANNVKLYNLKLNGDIGLLMDILQTDEYFTINSMIEDWEVENPGYTVFFNGRSGGHLVLGYKDSNTSIMSPYIDDNETYEEFKEEIRSYYGSLENYKSELVRLVELVQSFDMLCDDLRRECQYLMDNYKVVEEEIEVVKKETIRRVVEKEVSE